jgi:hypothetical protein
MSLPTAFRNLKNTKEIRTHEKEKHQLIRFAYRYRLAYCFTNTKADGVGTTLHGYNAIHKLFLAYTAYEQLLKSTYTLKLFGVKHIAENRIENLDMADKIRAQKYITEVLIKYTRDADLLHQLKEFEDNKNNDITCIAYAIRNIYAHGDLTPTAMKIRSIKRGKIFFDLADFLLEYCDEIFTKVIDKLR